MINWLEVDSTAIVAIAYNANAEAIHVRYKDGAEWRYLACAHGEWDEFKSPSTSKGRYVNEVLKKKPGERLS